MNAHDKALSSAIPSQFISVVQFAIGSTRKLGFIHLFSETCLG